MGWPAGEQQEEMAKFLLSHSADVNAVDERNVSACLIAAATGTAASPVLSNICILNMLARYFNCQAPHQFPVCTGHRAVHA